MTTKMDSENSRKPNVLYVDDDLDNLSSFRYQFMEYYNITLAESAEEGYAKLKQKEFPIIIADQRMPGTTGTQFFEKIQYSYPKSKRMILTGFSDFQSIIDAINKGHIYYYLQKPWDEQEVRLVIKNALDSVEFENKNEELIRILKDANERLEISQEELRLRIEESVKTEARYRDLFENNPISIWEEDYSEVKKYLDTIKSKDIIDYNRHLDEHPEIIHNCINLIRVIDINQATLRTHKVKEKKELLNNLPALFKPKSLNVFKKEFMAILHNELKLEEETSIVTLSGETLYVTIIWSVSPGFENSYARVLISMFDIIGRKLAEEKIRTTLKEKEILLKEVHHRVKNNMQIIYSLLDLQANFLTDDRMTEVLQTSQNRIQAMALVHELLYKSPDFTSIDIKKYFTHLAEYLVCSYITDKERIEIVIDIDNLTMSIDKIIPIGLIVNEIISNSLKHAFPERRQGRILFSMKKDSNKNCVILLSDNGIGTPDEINTKDQKTLGLFLISSLTEQIDGTLQISGSNSGTEYTITFKAE
ncbi:MAG: histidine kinase dimerization/phosphoacceptor domain -containing protein [Ignavibacteria bacterium]